MILKISKIRKYNIFLIVLLNITLVMAIFGRDTDYARNQGENGDPLFHRYVSDIEISPNFKNDQTVFSVLHKSGIYKSTNAGKSWIPVNNGFPNLDVCDVTISPNFAYDKTVMALTTTNDPNDFGFLMVTQNSGQSWQKRAQFQGLREGMIAFSPNTANR